MLRRSLRFALASNAIWILAAAALLDCGASHTGTPCSTCSDAGAGGAGGAGTGGGKDAGIGGGTGAGTGGGEIADGGHDAAPLDAGDAGDGSTPPEGPVDGYGLYEACAPGVATCATRLAVMAAGGFKLVLNYELLYGTPADVHAYFQAAAQANVRIIAAMNAPALFNLGANAATLPYKSLLTACGGACTTVQQFVDYVVGLVKGESALWGYYVGDEIKPANIPAWETYSAAVHAADPTHPRLIVEEPAYTPSDAGPANPAVGAVAPYAEVVAQDFYPIGDTLVLGTSQTTGAIAANVRTYAENAGKDWGMVLQSMSWQSYGPPTLPLDAGGEERCQPYPSCAPFPTEMQMQSMRDQVLALGAPRPRLILWYSYFDVLGAPNDGGAAGWSALQAAIAAP